VAPLGQACPLRHSSAVGTLRCGLLVPGQPGAPGSTRAFGQPTDGALADVFMVTRTAAADAAFATTVDMFSHRGAALPLAGPPAAVPGSASVRPLAVQVWPTCPRSGHDAPAPPRARRFGRGYSDDCRGRHPGSNVPGDTGGMIMHGVWFRLEGRVLEGRRVPQATLVPCGGFVYTRWVARSHRVISGNGSSYRASE
jgi:hypothetical protein